MIEWKNKSYVMYGRCEEHSCWVPVYGELVITSHSAECVRHCGTTTRWQYHRRGEGDKLLKARNLEDAKREALACVAKQLEEAVQAVRAEV